jgi:methionyl-tRNA formyltransferase
LNVVFLGSPDFCIPILEQLFQSKHKICAVVTPTDKIRARGHKVLFTPVKEFALAKNIPVLQPESLKSSEFIEELKSFNADLFVVVAFRILPKEVYSIPKYGSFNLHGSLLPKYRGAAPIQWAVINGDKETGLTTFMLADKVDTGNMILQERMEILDDDDFGTLHDKLSVLGAGMVLKTIDLIEEGNIELRKQADELATPAPKITKEMCLIDWSKKAEDIKNLIRGLSPVPAAYFNYNGKMIKVFKTKVNTGVRLNPGEIIVADDKIIAGCGTGSLEILELQLEGKKRMDSSSFLRGNHLFN